MAAQLFTVLNNGSTNYNIISIVFNTPAGIQHVADLTNFGGSASFTGATFSGSNALNIGQSKTFTVDHEYLSGPEDTRFGTIDILTDAGPTATINTTICVGTACASLGAALPGQGVYTAARTNITNGESFITVSLTSNGTFQVDCVDGIDFTGAWTTPWPSSGIGEFYWVRFTRQSSTGVGNYQSTPTTGWLQLNSARSVTVSAFGLPNGSPSSASVQYLVEVSSSSSGSPIIASGTYTLVPTGTLGGIVNPLDTVDINVIDFESASGSVSFNRSGSVRKFESQNDTIILNPWFLNGSSTVGDSYYIRATLSSGVIPLGPALNTWHSLSTNNTWALVATGRQEKNSVINIDISVTSSTAGIVTSGVVNFDILSYLNDQIIFSGSGVTTGDGYVYIPPPSPPPPVSSPEAPIQGPPEEVKFDDGSSVYIYPDGTVISYPPPDAWSYPVLPGGTIISSPLPPGTDSNIEDTSPNAGDGGGPAVDQFQPLYPPGTLNDEGNPVGNISVPITGLKPTTPVTNDAFGLANAQPQGAPPDPDANSNAFALANTNLGPDYDANGNYIGDGGNASPGSQDAADQLGGSGTSGADSGGFIEAGSGPTESSPGSSVPDYTQDGADNSFIAIPGSPAAAIIPGESLGEGTAFDLANAAPATEAPGCPDPKMNILLHDGQLIPAGQLKKGMLVRTKHSTTLEWGNFEVANTVEIAQPKLRILLDDLIFVCSKTHRFHLEKNVWKYAAHLKVGDRVGNKFVRSIEEIGIGPVIKITVDTAETYIVEGLLSHNVKYVGSGNYLGSLGGGGGSSTLAPSGEVDPDPWDESGPGE